MNRFLLHLGFKCECGESNTNKLIMQKDLKSNKNIRIVCLTCEQHYIINITTEKIPIFGGIKNG